MAILSSILAGKSHRQRSLVGDSPWGRKESDTTGHSACMQAYIELHAKILYQCDFSIFDKYSLHVCSVGHCAKCLE